LLQALNQNRSTSDRTPDAEVSRTAIDERLRFRRQFVLTASPVEAPADWQCLKVDEFCLYAHPDLEVTRVDDSTQSLVLLGCLYDSRDADKNNEDILKDVFARAHTPQQVAIQIKQYAGAYALLYKRGRDFVVFQDALALREVYYCTADNQVICASQPTLIAAFACPPLEPDRDPDFVEFLEHQFKGPWDSKWIGDATTYKDVKHLLPNHCLHITTRTVERYWPTGPIERLDLDEAVSRSCAFLQGALKAIARRQPVMMAVTAGTDSRTLLAASRSLRDRIYYFVNNEDLGPSHPDIAVPTAMCGALGVTLHVHDVPKQVDGAFREVFLNNTSFATERLLPTVYNVYFRNHGEKLNVLGIGEIGRTRFGPVPRKLTSYLLAYKLGYTGGRWVMKECQRILEELVPAGRQSGVNPLTLLYWEHMMGNWGVVGNSESDIAIEEVNPFNSHLLYETLLGVDTRYTSYKNNILFREMIRRMWPDVLKWPINPPHTRRDKIMSFMRRVHVFGFLKNLKYRMNYAQYRWSARRSA